MPHVPAPIAGAATATAKCPKRCVAGTARPGQLGELALEHLAAARELQRALETSCFASTLQAEGKS